MAKERKSKKRSTKGNTGVGWYKPKVIEVSFEGIGYPQFWAKLMRADSYLYGTSKEYEEIDEDAPREVWEGILAEKITDWNLTDPKTGEPLELPSKENLTSLNLLPNEFLFVIRRAVEQEAEDLEAEGLVKKGIEMSSEAISEEFESKVSPDGS